MPNNTYMGTSSTIYQNSAASDKSVHLKDPQQQQQQQQKMYSVAPQQPIGNSFVPGYQHSKSMQHSHTHNSKYSRHSNNNPYQSAMPSHLANANQTLISSNSNPSFGLGQANSSFLMQPTASSPTTDVSRDMAFSTNSTNSSQEMEPHGLPGQLRQQSISDDGAAKVTNVTDRNEALPSTNNVSFKQPYLPQRFNHHFNDHQYHNFQNNNNGHHFISSSAPTYTSSDSYYYHNNQFNQNFNNVKNSGNNINNNNNNSNNNNNNNTFTTEFPTFHQQRQQIEKGFVSEKPEQVQPPAIDDPLLEQNDTKDEHTQSIDIATHDVEDLLIMLSALLQKIVDANDLLHADGEHPNSKAQQEGEGEKKDDYSQGMLNSKYTANILAFHGRNVPAISLHAYLTRILKYCPVTNDVFLTLLVYFDRIAKRANNEGNNLSINSTTDLDPSASTSKNNKQVFVMDSYNIHRLIISGITVSSKFSSDVFYKNSRYAKVGGLPLDELNHLELQMLLLLDFELLIQKEELEKYGDLLMKFWKRESYSKN